MGKPTGVCGTLMPPDSAMGRLTSYRNQAVCIRDIWQDGDCIWHAEETGKPEQALVNSRTNQPERLDGAYLEGTLIPRSINFEECSLQQASFRECDATQINFKDADLRGCDFSGSTLFKSDFESAIASWGTFDDSTLIRAKFTGALLIRASFCRVDADFAEFQGASIENADFEQASLDRADFAQVEATSWTNFDETSLQGAQFTDVNLDRASFCRADADNAGFQNAVVERADFEQASLSAADFTRADARYAVFEHANLFDSTFNDANIHGATLESAKITSRTDLPDPDSQGGGGRISQLGTRVRTWIENKWGSITDWIWGESSVSLDAERWTYGELQRLYQRNGEREQAREAFRKRKDTKTREYRENHQYFRWLSARITSIVMRYGDDPYRIVGVSGFLIAAFAWLYTFYGGVKPAFSDSPPIESAGPLIPGSPLPDLGLAEFTSAMVSQIPGSDVFFMNLYFSTVTFTTLGYGDLQPATGFVRFLAAFESLLGALVMALAVFVFGRRATW